MIGGYYSSWGRKEEKEEEEKSYPLPRRERRKEERPRQRNEERKRQRERGEEGRVGLYPVEAEGCIHPYPSRGGYWGFDYLF